MPIYYINGALLILNCYPLYLVTTAAAVEATKPAALPQAGQIIGQPVEQRLPAGLKNQSLVTDPGMQCLPEHLRWKTCWTSPHWTPTLLPFPVTALWTVELEICSLPIQQVPVGINSLTLGPNLGQSRSHLMNLVIMEDLSQSRQIDESTKSTAFSVLQPICLWYDLHQCSVPLVFSTQTKSSMDVFKRRQPSRGALSNSVQWLGGLLG